MDEAKRFDRILRLYFLLQSKAVVSSEEIKARFGVSQRTIYRDIGALQAAGVPVLNEATAGYSVMEGYRLQPSRFSQEEILSLLVAEKIMQQHETQFVKQHFEAAMVKIKSSFRIHQKDDVHALDDKLQLAAPLSSDYLPNVIDVLLTGTLKKKVVTANYMKGGATEQTTRKMEPVGVFYENSFWYVLAYCHLRKDYRNFRLDRIKKVGLTDEGFTLQHPSINKLRQTKPAKNTTRITIKIERKFAHYLCWDRQALGFAEEDVCGDDVVMHFDCELHTTFFIRWFMKFADAGEIISPAHLQTELMNIITACLKRNSGSVEALPLV